MTLYKIKNLKTGLYSKGGVYDVKWGKKGKIWVEMRYLKNHLTQLEENGKQLYTHSKYKGLKQYKDCVILVFDAHESMEINFDNL